MEKNNLFEFGENPRVKPKNKKISNYFLQDHKDINSIIKDLEYFSGNPELKEETVQKIHWLLEKHFYMEEKVFLFPEEVNQYVGPKLAQSLMKQHDNLLAAFKGIEKCKEFISCPKFQKLKEMISIFIKLHFHWSLY